LLDSLLQEFQMETPIQQDLINNCANGSLDGVKALIEAGADPNVKDAAGNTPFITAVIYGEPGDGDLERTELRKFLASLRGLKPNLRDEKGQSALHFAAYYGRAEVIRTLLDRQIDADINIMTNDGDTPLMWAVGGGHIEAVKVLLDNNYNCDVEYKNDALKTAEDIARENGYEEIQNLIKEKKQPRMFCGTE